ncbi:hypothetical protein CAMSH0001_1560 [Campylobacter showae RM3277]|uniref:Uncharacterized protein n=1 Tax=Campylobacter showae RM3277 TaxID=553219 RepID=C6RCX4_9BACT|nr:hypothetical protein CAMSH0001_1560 [Campylobacter showae RM3277]
MEGLSRFDEYAARLGKFNLASIYILIAKRETNIKRESKI